MLSSTLTGYSFAGDTLVEAIKERLLYLFFMFMTQIDIGANKLVKLKCWDFFCEYDLWAPLLLVKRRTFFNFWYAG